MMASIWTWESENKNMKKDFQNVVKAFRDGSDKYYAKAMMTHQQELKGTATVNCGFGESSVECAKAFMAFPHFVAWCEAYGIKTITFERVKYYDNFQGQVRVTY